MEPKILLFDLLGMTDLSNVKVRFQVNDGTFDPRQVFVEDPERINTRWLFSYRDRRIFFVGQTAVSLVHMSGDHWLLTTIKRVDSDVEAAEGPRHTGHELTEYSAFFGRTIVRFHKRTQQGGLKAAPIAQDLEVVQVLPSVYDGEEFPGYDSVRLTHSQLKRIVDRRPRDWVSAPEHQQAVYLITDAGTGKHYVGSATSKTEMLLSRWSSYAKNGHGGNKKLRELVDEFGIEYVESNFCYSILENFNARTDADFVVGREAWWKNTLLSREYGYNEN